DVAQVVERRWSRTTVSMLDRPQRPSTRHSRPLLRRQGPRPTAGHFDLCPLPVLRQEPSVVGWQADAPPTPRTTSPVSTVASETRMLPCAASPWPERPPAQGCQPPPVCVAEPPCPSTIPTCLPRPPESDLDQSLNGLLGR